MPGSKTANLNLRIDPALKEAAARAAEDDRRSLTSLIEKLLVEHLKTTGYLPKGRGKVLIPRALIFDR